MIAFITGNSNVVPLLEGLCSCNPCRFEFSLFWVLAGIDDDLEINSPALWPTELVWHRLGYWNESFFGNFWGPPNFSSSCDNNHTYVKHLSFKNIIFGWYKMIKKPLRIHAKSLSDALAPSKKNCLRRWLRVALRSFRIYSWSAHCLPDFCQKGW